MPAAPYVFGSGYDQVAGQRFATDQMNIGIQREDAARRDAALQQQRAEWLAAQRQAADYAQAQQKAAFDSGLGQQNRADVMASNDQNRQDSMYRFNAGQKQTADQFAATEADRAAQRDTENKRYDAQTVDLKKEQQDRANEAAYRDAFNGVKTGIITDPAQLQSVPDLLPAHRAILAATLMGDQKSKVLADAQAATLAVKSDPEFKKAISLTYGTAWARATPLAPSEVAVKIAGTKPMIADSLAKLRWDVPTQQFVPVGFQMPGAPAAMPVTTGTGNTGWTPPPAAAPVGISSFGSPAPYTPPLAPAWTPPVVRSQVSPVTAPTAAPSANRVRVLSPQGKIGSIPAQQLGDALANGYILVK